MITVVLNSLIVIVLVFQVCMAAFFALNDKDYESLTCVIILILTTLYIVINTENVNDSNYEFQNQIEIEAATKTQDELDQDI